MSRLPMTYAGLSYFDRTLAIEQGRVVPDGIDLRWLGFDWPPELFRRQTQDAEFEASEMSTSTFLALLSRGDNRFVGLPVFVSRNFRHGQVYVNAASGIEAPADLRGRDVGIVEYQMTAAVWIRAFLQHDYGVAPEELHWWTGGLLEPGYRERLSIELPAGVRLDRIPGDRTLEAMLEGGELDALVTVQPPQAMRRPSPPVRRLFVDHQQVEREYFRRTGLFPIMHLVVLRRDVYERHPWAAASLVDAFTEAKRLGGERMRSLTGLAVGLPWLGPALDEVDALFGGDAFPYGVESNRRALEALTAYSFEQGLSVRRLEVDELFAPETLAQATA